MDLRQSVREAIDASYQCDVNKPIDKMSKKIIEFVEHSKSFTNITKYVTPTDTHYLEFYYQGDKIMVSIRDDYIVTRRGLYMSCMGNENDVIIALDSILNNKKYTVSRNTKKVAKRTGFSTIDDVKIKK
jgi:hypothetical protein